MVEIAKSHNVPFTPDPNVMRDDEVAAAEAMLIDFQNRGEVGRSALSLFTGSHEGDSNEFQQGYGWMYPPHPTDHTQGPPPPPPAGGAGGGGGGGMYPGVPHAPPTAQPFNYPPPVSI